MKVLIWISLLFLITGIGNSSLYEGLIHYYDGNGYDDKISGNDLSNEYHRTRISANCMEGFCYKFFADESILTTQIEENYSKASISFFARVDEINTWDNQFLMSFRSNERNYFTTKISKNSNVVHMKNRYGCSKDNCIITWLFSNETIKFTEWQNYILIFDEGKCEMYIDGRLKIIDYSCRSLAELPKPINFNIGSYSKEGERSVQGYIDEIGFWDRVLTQDEIKMISREDFSPTKQQRSVKNNKKYTITYIIS